MKSCLALRTLGWVLGSLLVVSAWLSAAPPPAAAQNPPILKVDLHTRTANGFYWQQDTLLTLTIDDLSSPGIEYQATSRAYLNPNFGFVEVYFDLAAAPLRPGLLVTLSDGKTTKSVILGNFSVSGYDFVKKAISGTGTPGELVHVCANGESWQTCWITEVGSDGKWIARPTASSSFILYPDSFGYAEEWDVDNDTTWLNWNVRAQKDWKIFAFPDQDVVELREAAGERNYSLTIARIAEPARVVYSTRGVFNKSTKIVEFPTRGFDLLAGDILKASDDVSTKMLVVAPPGTIHIDVDRDFAFGTAGPDEWVVISSEGGQRTVQAGHSGSWSADFSPKLNGISPENAQAVDFKPGSAGVFGEYDLDQDTTLYDWKLPLTGPVLITPQLAEIGQEVSVQVNFLQPGQAAGDELVWDWGDGRTSENLHPNLPTVTAAHAYQQPGIYFLALTVRRGNGRVSMTDHLNDLTITRTWTIQAYPDDQRVELANAFPSQVYTLAVARAAQPTQKVFSGTGGFDENSGNIVFRLQGFDLQAGDVLTTSDGLLTRSLVVAPRGQVQVDVDANLVRGSASPNQGVIFANGAGRRFTRADGSGRWSIDFNSPGSSPHDAGPPTQELTPQSQGRFGEVNPEGNFTVYSWQLADISSIFIPSNPAKFRQEITASIVFHQPGQEAGAALRWDWGDGSVTEDPQPNLANAAAAHHYTQPGIYDIRVTILTSSGMVSETEHYDGLVVSGISSGFVWGDGWFDSPDGASPTHSVLGRQASFSFAIAFPNFLNAPAGLTMFKADGFSFVSSSYDWIIACNSKLRLKGSGTVNGQGTYDFLLFASDHPGGAGGDRFRIKIWNRTSGVVVYDNQPGAGDTAEPLMPIRSGSILIP